MDQDDESGPLAATTRRSMESKQQQQQVQKTTLTGELCSTTGFLWTTNRRALLTPWLMVIALCLDADGGFNDREIL
jgi:hypothetical protein